MYEDLKKELRHAVDAVIESDADKKLVVAGPGAGKTLLFQALLEDNGRNRESQLVLTFINNLKNDLERELGEVSQVYTFHGYCRQLLHQNESLRSPLTEDFHYYPALPLLIESDWRILFEEPSPHFIAQMRQLDEGEVTELYIERANYYDAVSFDDSVFRVFKGVQAQAGKVDEYELVLVDEYQDFNRLEIEFIKCLADINPIVIAGDDDQALYSILRSSSPEYIRNLYQDGAYERFQLPFCMRCTAPIVEAVADVINHAQGVGRLQNRIPKPYRFYPPKKGADSEQYPRIKVVETTVQRLNANYFGRYVVEQIGQILEEEVQESYDDHFPTVLVIGPTQYIRQVRNSLVDEGYDYEMSEGEDALELDRNDGLRILQGDPQSNLGWRIVLEVDQPEFLSDAINGCVVQQVPLVDLLPEEYKEEVIEEALAIPEEQEVEEDVVEEQADLKPTIKLTTFEGSKGLSAQHVFIVGLHNGDLPRDPENMTDLEICKFIVALTRARKQCHLLYTRRWGNYLKDASRFIGWINYQSTERILVSKSYWD